MAIVIYNSKHYVVTSYGNGAAYLFARKNCEEAPIHVQGDDATVFRDEIEYWEARNPDMSSDEILRELWYQYNP